jgi:hypothetical protein
MLRRCFMSAVLQSCDQCWIRGGGGVANSHRPGMSDAYFFRLTAQVAGPSIRGSLTGSSPKIHYSVQQGWENTTLLCVKWVSLWRVGLEVIESDSPVLTLKERGLLSRWFKLCRLWSVFGANTATVVTENFRGFLWFPSKMLGLYLKFISFRLLPYPFPVIQSYVTWATDKQTNKQTNKQTPWPEFASELYRPSYRRLSAKLVPTFADRKMSRD